MSTFLPYYWTKWLGTETLSIKKIHEKHGHVVRINPNTLSFTTAQSWKDIYGLRSGRVQLPKVDVIAEKGYPRHLAATIDDAQHARARGLLSPAFSERAIREQESLIMKYVDLLIQRLKSQVLASMGGEVDLVRWYNFTTFDIVGDLSLGEPFGSLESGEYHVWITDIFKGLKNVILLRIVTAYPILEAILTCLVKLYPKVLEGQRVHRENTKVALQKRLATKTERKDFISYFPHELTGDELNSNAMMLLLAGSETSATLLSGATYYLLTNKSALDKLCNEVRSTFQSESEITFTSVARLRYLNAVIEESFRLYPPVPGVLGRRTLPEGNVIDGQYIPGNVSRSRHHSKGNQADQMLQTVVGIYQLVAYKSKYNFRHPDKFIPERWLDEPLYADDQRAVLQPFSTGPRNCLGRT